MNAACAVDPALIVMAATEQDVSAGELRGLVHIPQLVPLYWCLVEYPRVSAESFFSIRILIFCNLHTYPY